MTQVNALSNNAIDRLQQLWDGSILLKLALSIDGDIEDHEDPKERLKSLVNYLQGCYGDQKPQISWSRIFFEQAEREIGKACALLLCQSVECVKKDGFIQVILGLDEESQLNIKQIIEFVLVGSPATSLRPDFADILDQPCYAKDTVAASPQLPFSPITRSTTSQQYYSNSPTREFLNSPQIGAKIALREYKKRIQILERELRNEAYLRQEKEQELEENRTYLIEKDGRIEQLKGEIKHLQHLRYIEDDLNISKLAERAAQEEIVKLKDRLSIIGELKMDISSLRKENASLLDERCHHQQLAKNYETLQREIAELKKSINEAGYKHQQLMMQCETYKQNILEVIQEKEDLKTIKDERENLLKEEIQQLEDRICQQVNEEFHQGESLGFILEKRVGDLELEKGNLAMKLEQQYVLEKQSATEKEQKLNEMSAMNVGYEKQLTDLRTQMTGLQKDYDIETQNKRSLTKEFHSRLRDISQQQQEIMETAQQEKEKYEKDLLEKNKQIVEMEKSREGYILEKSGLRGKIDKLQSSLDDMRQKQDMDLRCKMDDFFKQKEDEIINLQTEFDLKCAKVIAQKDSQIENLKMKYNERVSSTEKENEDLKHKIHRANSEMERFNSFKTESEKKLRESESRGDLYKAKLQKMVNQYTTLRTSHESHCAETDGRLKRYECERLNLSTRLQSLQNECEIFRETQKTTNLEIKTLTQKFLEEQRKNITLQQRLRSSEVQLSHAEREIQSRKANGAPTSHKFAVPRTKTETESSDGAMSDDIQHDSIDWQDQTFRLSDLEISQMSRKSKLSNLETSKFNSRESLTSIDSRRDSTMFDITMMSKTSLKHDASIMSDKDASFEFGNHVIPKLDSSLASLNCTLDTTDKQTTGRAGFVYMGGCEDEPEHFDWDRVSEMQRRNTLCPPHLRTAYPIETQNATPSKVEENSLRNKIRKRKAFMFEEEENQGARRKLRSSMSLNPSKTRRLTPRKSTSAQNIQQHKETVQIGKESAMFSIGFTPLKDKQKRKSLRLAKKDKKETQNAGRESTAFSIGFTPLKERKEKWKKAKLAKAEKKKALNKQETNI
ncbi:uncharacterized protein LOC100377654 [Saccoglossus kowalevskii]